MRIAILRDFPRSKAIIPNYHSPAGEAEKHLIGELIELSEDKELEAILHSIIPEYSHSLVSDCLHNIDILLSRLNHEQLRELFLATYKKIEFSPAEQAFLLTKNTEDQPA